jgi:hypothetical protein
VWEDGGGDPASYPIVEIAGCQLYLIRVHPAAKELLIQPFDETFDSSNALRQLFHRRCI